MGSSFKNIKDVKVQAYSQTENLSTTVDIDLVISAKSLNYGAASNF